MLNANQKFIIRHLNQYLIEHDLLENPDQTITIKGFLEEKMNSLSKKDLVEVMLHYAIVASIMRQAIMSNEQLFNRVGVNTLRMLILLDFEGLTKKGKRRRTR